MGIVEYFVCYQILLEMMMEVIEVDFSCDFIKNIYYNFLLGNILIKCNYGK